MSMPYGQPQPSVVAGWYPDPRGAGHRWWDGAQWTEHTQPVAVSAPSTSVAAPGYGQVHPGVSDGGYGGYAQAGNAVGPGFSPSYQSGVGAATYPASGGWGPGSTGYGFDAVAKPTNGLATAALVAGVVVVAILLFFGFAIASGIALILGVRALRKARSIKAAGYPTAVGMGRAVAGLVLSGIGVLSYLLTWFVR